MLLLLLIEHRVCFVQDSDRGTPVFVFLSPGVDVAAAVEALGRKSGYTTDNGKYSAVSLGQVTTSKKLHLPNHVDFDIAIWRLIWERLGTNRWIGGCIWFT